MRNKAFDLFSTAAHTAVYGTRGKPTVPVNARQELAFRLKHRLKHEPMSLFKAVGGPAVLAGIGYGLDRRQKEADGELEDTTGYTR